MKILAVNPHTVRLTSTECHMKAAFDRLLDTGHSQAQALAELRKRNKRLFASTTPAFRKWLADS